MSARWSNPVAAEHAVSGGLVFAGFSQGVAMAFRAAAASTRPVSGIVVCGGDVPPELGAASLARIPAVLIGRGLRDGWYTAEKGASDRQRLREARIRVTPIEFDGGHEWPAPFIDAARRFSEPVPMIDIRPATVDDAAALAELRWEFRSPRPDANEPRDRFIARCTAWMRAELGGTTWRAWVAVKNGHIIGNAWVGTISKLPNPAPEREQHAYVSNVYVTPAARGGIGRALLDAALADAATRADRVILWPSSLSIRCTPATASRRPATSWNSRSADRADPFSDDPLRSVERRGVSAGLFRRQVERMIAAVDDVERRWRPKRTQHGSELLRRTERIAAALHEQHRARDRRQVLIAPLVGPPGGWSG